MDNLQKLEAVKLAHENMVKAECALAELQAMTKRTTQIIRDAKVSAGGNKRSNEDLIIREMSVREQYVKSVEEYADALAVAHAVLNQIDRPEWYDILFKRYIRFMTWKQIAAETGYSMKNCMVIHRKAAKSIR